MVGFSSLLFLYKIKQWLEKRGKGAINLILKIVMASASPLFTSLIVLHAGRFFTKEKKYLFKSAFLETVDMCGVIMICQNICAAS